MCVSDSLCSSFWWTGRNHEEADAFIAMPGGFGTLDEIFEVVVLNQLRVTDKPIALYNTLNYYDKLIEFIDHAVTQGFIRKEHRDNIIVSDNPEILFRELSRHKSIGIDQWIKYIKTETLKYEL